MARTGDDDLLWQRTRIHQFDNGCIGRKSWHL